MSIISNSKHERFAQLVARGLSFTAAYIEAGYSKNSARANGSRLMTNDAISARIMELKGAVARQVVDAEIRRRSWRVQVLQERVEKALELSRARAKMYGDQMSESHEFQVQTREAEKLAIAEGCRPAPPRYSPPAAPTVPPKDWKDLPGAPAAELPPPEYPKMMIHPGYPNGGATGLLIKDYRGKNAEQEIWKFDSSLEARIADNLKQAAIEEGQWNEKQVNADNAEAVVVRQRLKAAALKVVELKKAAIGRGETW